jgi:hypothetical protein
LGLAPELYLVQTTTSKDLMKMSCQLIASTNLKGSW